MSTSVVKSLIESKNLPSFLTKGLAPFDRVSKVFPSIGLTNCSKEIHCANEVAAAAAYALARSILSNMALAEYCIPFYDDKRHLIIDPIMQIIAIDYNEFVSIDEKISIKLPIDISYKNKIVFKKGQSLFKIYNEIQSKAQKLTPLSDIEEFKIFSSVNLGKDTRKIVFSSTDVDGLYDIATMSMRGFRTCQSWDGKYKDNLIGSIIDPFTGIIYLTSGSTTMIRRSIVRYVIDKNKVPSIVIDRMYPEFDEEVMKEFVSFIKEKTNNKFEVLAYPIILEHKSDIYIPTSSIHNKIKRSHLSYRDTKIPFKFEIDVPKSISEKNIISKQNKFKKILRKSIFSLPKSKFKVPNLKNKILKDQIQSILDAHDIKFHFEAYYDKIAKSIIKSGPNVKDFESSAEYMRRLCYHYLSNKNSFKKEQISFVKKIVSYWALDKKLPVRNFTFAFNAIQRHIDSQIKAEIRATLTQAKKIAKSSKNA